MIGRSRLTVFAAATAFVALLGVAGCTSEPVPVMDAREALGTVVSITAYTAEQAAEEDVAAALDSAYGAMDAVEGVLDAHAGDGDSIPAPPRRNPNKVPTHAIEATSVADFNADPTVWRTLPVEVTDVLAAVDTLDVTNAFSPTLLEVTALYDFEEGGSVPDTTILDYYVAASRTLETSSVGGVMLVPEVTASRFDWYGIPLPVELDYWGPFRIRRAGLDLGGAAKGYAIDEAVAVLTKSAAADAALVTAGSTTVTFGSKPDGEPWRIGIEHPRQPEGVIATVEGIGGITVSTSGDYQRYFERDGVRYHHILDPATGMPARGLQSLTVVGAPTGLDSDILATALFVMGEDRAMAYAQENGLGLILVDDEGRVRIAPGPESRSWEIVVESE